MRTLVLITSKFPFGTGESFIASELPVLISNFDKTIIIAQNISEDKTREIPEEVTVYRYNPSTSLPGLLYSPILCLRNLSSIVKLFKEETVFRESIGYRLSSKKFLQLLKRIIKALQLRDYIKGIMVREGIDRSIVFYSYWLKTGAHAISMLSYKDSIKIARAHGSDLYEESSPVGYLPLLKFASLNLDAIFFTSKQGREYLSDKLKTTNNNFHISYLGVDKPYPENYPDSSAKYVIISCSNIVALKRIDLIIKALELVRTDKNILWLHFGDGIFLNEISALAEEKLKHIAGLEYKFMGHYPNNELLKFYSTNRIDLFINASSTEGIPVSIMEAQSYGIPVIATDVGGVSELVNDGNGVLLAADFKPEKLTVYIEHFISLSEEEVKKIRENAVNNWKSNFNATINYNDFIKKLNSILASVNKKA